MTTPGGVPNLPQGALTADTLATNLQDMSGGAMKDRAVERFPSIMDNSTGLSPALDFSPFGILTRIFAEVQSLIATADPADIQGPEDIPELLINFIEGLPVIGQFFDLFEAIMGTYTGDDAILLAVQDIFAPIRALMQMFAGIVEGFPGIDEITAGVGQFLGAFAGLDLTDPGAILTAITNALAGIIGDIVHAVTGILGGGLPDLTSWAADIPILGDIVHAITGLAGGDLGSLTGWFTDLLGIIGNPLGLGSGTVSLGALTDIPLLGPIVGFVQQMIDGLISLITGGLSTSNPLGSLFDVFGDFVNSLFGFGSAGSGLPIIGSGQVATVAQNLLINGDFHDAAAFTPSLGISWDGTQTHSGTGGSAKFTLSGVEKSLLSNGIDVVAGDKLDLVAWTKWSGLTGSGPISLMLNTYNAAGTLVSTITSDSVASPGASGGWTQLAGQYTVPAGVVEVSARFTTAAALTAGTVWFDDASVKKPNTVSPTAVGGPLAGVGNLFEDITDLVDTIAGSIGGALTDVADRLADMLTPVSPLNGSNINLGNIAVDFIGDLQSNFNNIVQNLLGWDPPPAGTWYGPIDSATALGSQSDTVLGMAGTQAQHATTLADHVASITNLLSRVNTLETSGGGSSGPPPSGVGVSAADDFERSGAMGANWSNSNSSYQLDGHNAYWNVSSYTARTTECIWQGTNSSSTTDYQVVLLTIGNGAPVTGFGGYYGWNHVHGRVSLSQKCTFSVRSDGYWQFTVSGSIIASGTIAKLGIGSSMSLYCGDKPTTSLNTFTCSVNNATAWKGTASSVTGAGSRGWGFGSQMDGTGTPLFGQYGAGGRVNQWYAADVV